MDNILQPISRSILEGLNKTQLLTLIEGEQNIRTQLEAQVSALKAAHGQLEEEILNIEGKYVRLKKRLFCPSTEKSPKPQEKKTKKTKSPRKKTTRLPSERYPNLPIEEVELEYEQLPDCQSCGKDMAGTNMFEISEMLTVTPKKYHITRQFRKKYRCSCCHSALVTTPVPPRIIPKSSYSDEMIIDVALSKYCDLIPIERYCAMANRASGTELPPNSLISLTHKLADFVKPIYSEGLKGEIIDVEVLFADETSHKMLEGDDQKNWYLWGFSGPESAYFEYHDTRSGSVASDILLETKASVLLSDAFSGYAKAIRLANVKRHDIGKKTIKKALCNAHSRRKFDEADKFEESKFYMKQYRRIYKLEKHAKNKPADKARARKISGRIFSRMKARASADLGGVSKHSDLARAIYYFLNNFEGLTLNIKNLKIPVDNNQQERLFRSPVIGRKTWSGTHSKKGARTAAILFSIVESCKLIKVNPRQYFKDMVNMIHTQNKWLTPAKYKEFIAQTKDPPPN